MNNSKRYFAGFIQYLFLDGETLLGTFTTPSYWEVPEHLDSITVINRTVYEKFIEFKQENPTVSDFLYDFLEVELLEK